MNRTIEGLYIFVLMCKKTTKQIVKDVDDFGPDAIMLVSNEGFSFTDDISNFVEKYMV